MVKKGKAKEENAAEKPKAKEGGLSFRSKWEQEPTTKPRKTLEGFASTAFGTRSKPAVELS